MRADLNALTQDALAALSNRGLVKRAVKTVEEGAGPTVSMDGESVQGEHPDGTVTILPPSGLDAASCSCGAGSVCRHVLALVLAYQTTVGDGGAEAAFEDWSPAEFTDAELEAVIGVRGLAAARKVFAAGFAARVARPTAADPVPRVELPTCTVRFLVPHELAYARSDAAAGNGLEALALAVWAFQAADEPDSHNANGYVQIGGLTQAGLGDGFAHTSELSAEVLLTGAVHLGTGFAPRLAQSSQALDVAGLRWPLLAVEELAELLDSYERRSTRYRPERLADLLAELHARHRAAAFPGGSARSRILGTEEAAETRLSRVRLTGLGCRVDAVGDERRVQIFLADGATGTVLTLNHTWPTGGDNLAQRRLAGSTVSALAAGNVVTETALRGADRRLRLGVNRIARTTVSPSSGNWDAIPPSLLVRDLDALTAELDRLPPRLIRPRVAAEDVRVLEIGDVGHLGYSPGSQRIDAIVTASGGGTARIVAEHKPVAPAALDTLAEALSGDRGTPRYLSGTFRRGRGGIVVTPIAIVADGAVIVPDLTPGDGSTALEAGLTDRVDPLVAAINSALATLAEMAHQGIRHLPATFANRLDAAAGILRATGLPRAADDLRALSRTLGPNPGDAAVEAWADAEIRLLTLADAV
jgi:hypothetical protein